MYSLHSLPIWPRFTVSSFPLTSKLYQKLFGFSLCITSFISITCPVSSIFPMGIATLIFPHPCTHTEHLHKELHNQRQSLSTTLRLEMGWECCCSADTCRLKWKSSYIRPCCLFSPYHAYNPANISRQEGEFKTIMWKKSTIYPKIASMKSRIAIWKYVW